MTPTPREAIVACIGDAEGQHAVCGHKMLLLTKGQVQLLAAALESDSAPRVSEAARAAEGELLSGGFAGLAAAGSAEVGAD